MIEKTAAYKTSDGKRRGTLEEAQIHEIETLVDGLDLAKESIGSHIVSNAAKVVDILSTTPTSRAKARKVNGGTKKRAPRTETSTPEAQ